MSNIVDISTELARSLAQPTRSILDVPHGLHLDVPDETYFERRLDAVHKHRLDMVLRAPALLKTAMVGEEEDPAKALVFGQAFHCALLQPTLYDKKRWSSRLSSDDFDTIDGMVASARCEDDDALAPRMLERGVPEMTARWRDEKTSLECTCRADLWIEELAMLVDVKSCSDGSWDGFRYASEQFGYFRQDAWYREGWRACGHTVGAFVFMCVEKKPPYLVSFFEHTPEDIEAGTKANRKAIDKWAECLRGGRWPGYEQRIQTVKLRSWALER